MKKSELPTVAQFSPSERSQPAIADQGRTADCLLRVAYHTLGSLGPMWTAGTLVSSDFGHDCERAGTGCYASRGSNSNGSRSFTSATSASFGCRALMIRLCSAGST
jgi:hypothetical protein